MFLTSIPQNSQGHQKQEVQEIFTAKGILRRHAN